MDQMNAEKPDDVLADLEAKHGSRAAPGSAPSLTREQIAILDHAEHRAPGGFYCGGGKDMDALVAAGLMAFAGRKSFVPDPYYRITGKGRAALAQNRGIGTNSVCASKAD